MFEKNNVNEMYPNIFKRKSFHLFRNNKTKELYKDNCHIIKEEIDNIYKVFKSLVPLYNDIKVNINIVNSEETNCNRGQEYLILFYSEKKPNYLQNIGFIGEQLDLYLVNNDIGTLWYGIGKPKELTFNGLSFVTMMAICKVPHDAFRKDMFKSKRKDLSEIYEENKYSDIINIARFSPSSCNTQPWFVKQVDNNIEIYRYKKPGKRGIMPIEKVVYQNLIDIGIFMLFVLLTLSKNNYQYELELFDDYETNDKELTKIANIIIGK